MSLQVWFVWYSSSDLPGAGDFWDKDGRDKVPFLSHHIKGVCYQHDSSLWTLVVIAWLLVSVCQVLYSKVTIFPFPHCTPWEKGNMCSPHLSCAKLCSASWRAEHLHKLFRIFLRFVYPLSFIHSFTHSIIYLYQSGLLDFYFILWIILQYYLIYFVAQMFYFWPSKPPLFGSFVLLCFACLF